MSNISRFAAITLIAVLVPLTSQAAWVEAKGQAIVENDNIEMARQHATQEAIKQAMLFSGASIKSVQKMANGLLKDDRFEIRSSGEVNHLELIDEHYSGDVISVSIRADIFAQQHTCDSSDYKKTIATTFYPIAQREQATVGNVFDIGRILPSILQKNVTEFASHASITSIAPFYPASAMSQADNHVQLIARKANSQYVLLGEVLSLDVETTEPAAWALWQAPQSERQFGFHVTLYDGQSGAVVWQKQYNIGAQWPFELHETVDVSSNRLWQSSYGKAVDSVMQDISQNIDEKLACLPSYGRVLLVENEKLRINIGENQGVQKGDELSLFQINQFHDPQGQLHAQFSLHPSKVKILAVFPDSAIAGSADGQFLANIQPNDFVSRR